MICHNPKCQIEFKANTCSQKYCSPKCRKRNECIRDASKRKSRRRINYLNNRQKEITQAIERSKKPSYKEKARIWRAANPLKRKHYDQLKYTKMLSVLPDYYIKRCCFQDIHINIPKELINLKRIHIQLHRTLKQTII